MIRLTVPSIEEDDLAAVREVVASGHLVKGPRVAAFEQAIADLVGTRHAVAVTNGTAALQMALIALDVGKDDIVVTTAYSWPATANVIELCGATPAFVDIRPDTFNIDPAGLESTMKRLTTAGGTAKRVKAILPVHAFGQMADMHEIMEIGRRYNVPIVEDAACALGATFDGRQAGAWGVMGCFSFHPRKAITTGEGGMITTDDAAIARRLRALRNHGQDPDAATPDFILPGFNNRMTEFQGALGQTQMRKLSRVIAARFAVAQRYDKLLIDSPLTAPRVGQGAGAVYQSYVTLLPEAATSLRPALIAGLKQKGIETAIGTWHMPMIRYYRTRYGFRPGDFPAADSVFARALTLPVYETLTAQEQQTVVDTVASELSEHESIAGAPTVSSI
jgi:dTDP-4-amino-4,6-dideoxygalactose transaminase